MKLIARQEIERIHRSGRRFVVAVTGGGSRAISELLSAPGGSRSLLEAIVPYSPAAMTCWLGGDPDQYCSEHTARAMAMAGFMRARALAPQDDPHALVGVGCTASLVSDRPKRGAHRVHVAWQTATTTGVLSQELARGARDRVGEEEFAAALVLDAMNHAVGERAENPFQKQLDDARRGRESAVKRVATAPPEWTELLLGERETVFVNGSAPQWTPPPPRAVLPGAFNPPHAGHARMAEVGAARLGEPVWFELSLTNVEKPPLDFIELTDHLSQIASPVVITRAPRFVEKSRLFPGATFLVGVDTIARIADARFYDDDASRVDAAIDAIAVNGCRFLVFGRLIGDAFITLKDLELPPFLRNICDGATESEFREDISSSELRKTARNGG